MSNVRISRLLTEAMVLIAVGCSNGSPGGPSKVQDGQAQELADAGPDMFQDAPTDEVAEAGADATGMAITDAVGGACILNADCANSPAAEEAKGLRCVGRELYCLDGTCHAGCAATCEVVRSDINPCPEPRLCAAAVGGSLSLCVITPVSCMTAENCPTYRPVDATGNQGAWTCVDGLCVYPGFTFATQ